MNGLFEIQTLSERKRLGDPVTIITAIGTIFPQLFPNLTGSERLTMQHLNQLFPGNGHYTSQYKNWLLQRVRYLKDLERDLHMYTGQFIEANMQAICQGKTGQGCWENFYNILRQEATTGGSSPVGNVFTAGMGLDLQTLILIGGGIFLLVALTKKKRRRK